MDKDQTAVIQDFIKRILSDIPDLSRPWYGVNYEFIYDGVKVELGSKIGHSPSLFLDGCEIDTELLQRDLVSKLQEAIIKEYFDKRKRMQKKSKQKEEEIVSDKLKDLVRKISN